MERIFILIILSFLSIIFGLIGKKITNFEKPIFRKKYYFPLFTGVLSILCIIFIFININLAILFFSFSLIAFVWHL
ncbi:MAG: hypothetical protein QXX68_00600 [Candidatus Pacearchaeota archaeon]